MQERQPHPLYERHHLEHRRTSFITKLQKTVRNQPGLIVPAHTINHRLLHLRVSPQDAPSSWLCNVIVSQMEEYPAEDAGRYTHATMLAGDLWHISEAEPSPERAEESSQHSLYLMHQIGILLMSVEEARTDLASTHPLRVAA